MPRNVTISVVARGLKVPLFWASKCDTTDHAYGDISIDVRSVDLHKLRRRAHCRLELPRRNSPPPSGGIELFHHLKFELSIQRQLKFCSNFKFNGNFQCFHRQPIQIHDHSPPNFRSLRCCRQSSWCPFRRRSPGARSMRPTWWAGSAGSTGMHRP